MAERGRTMEIGCSGPLRPLRYTKVRWQAMELSQCSSADVDQKKPQKCGCRYCLFAEDGRMVFSEKEDVWRRREPGHQAF